MRHNDNGKARRQRAAKRKLAAILRSKRDYSIEGLESRLYLSQGLPPAIVVGRTLSSYTTGGVVNSQETITYTVYNEQADSETGVLLTDTLQPGITVASASQQPDQSGQNLAWSLGTIQGFDRASVTLTINLPSTIPTQLDTGAQAYATLDAGSVSNSTPAATLRTGFVDPTLLDATPDTDATDLSDAKAGPIADPYIQEEAAALDYNAQNIFNFLHDDIGYNSYTGSLRGARGTLWSEAGNALDVASLGVALMRASGIPAQYIAGTLSQSQAQQLILSMFPASDQTVGYVPAGTQVSNPASDPQLLAETESHYWFQFDTGSGMQDADPLMAAVTGGTIGQTFTTSTGTFTEVPDSLRQTTEVSLTAEIYSQADMSLGLANPLTETVVLDQTFNDVNLVGRPLTIGNFVASSTTGGLDITATTNTYTPYTILGDAGSQNPGAAETVTGTPYQEVLTNFPLGSQVLTGLFLNINLAGALAAESYERTLLDRIGYAVRQGSGTSSVTPNADGSPAFTQFDTYTLDALPGLADPNAGAQFFYTASQDAAELQALQTAGASTASEAPLISSFTVAQTSEIANDFQTRSDLHTAQIAAVTGVKAYFDRPRLTIVSSRLVIDAAAQTATPVLSIDLRRDTMRVVAAPGQNPSATVTFNFLRGIYESVVEGDVLQSALPLVNGQPAQVDTTSSVFELAQAQGIGLAVISSSNLTALDALTISADAKARITTAIGLGMIVVVPTANVTINGAATTAWYQINPTTGETIGVTEDGGHAAFIDYVPALAVTVLAGLGISVIGFLAGYIYGVLGGVGAIYSKHTDLTDLSKDKTKAAEDAGILAKIPFFKEGLAAGFGAGDPAAKDVAGLDPAIYPLLSNPEPILPPSDTADVNVSEGSVLTAGMVGITDTVSSFAATDVSSASWSSSEASGFSANSLSASGATITSGGLPIGSGDITLASPSDLPLSVSGNVDYSVTGSGSLSFYGAAETSLGVGGEWTGYSAALTGNPSITLTTSSLTLNGTALPSGTYTITASSATLGGSGQSTSPNFSGSASFTANSGTLDIGPGTGSVTVAGVAIDPTSGVTLDGYTGTATVSPNGDGTDSVTLDGNATNVLTVSAAPNTFTTDQNTPLTFTPSVNSSLNDTYDLVANAPAGWTVSIDSSGDVTVMPASGVQGGTYPIQIIAQSSTDANLVAQTTVNVSITPTSPGINLTVPPDPLFTVPFNGAELPTAFRATIQNLGPSADTYNVSGFDVPSGFTLVTSEPTVTVPAGQTGFVGLYLVPNTGQPIPAPGMVLTFDLTATSTSNPAITQTQAVSLTIPSIDAVTVTSTPTQVNTTPGTAATDTITVTDVGNVPEYYVVLTSTQPSGLTVSGLAPLSVAVGQSASETITLTPDPSTPLNTLLDTTITATYGPVATPVTQTLDLPVNVVVPGAAAIADAATAAEQLGNTSLANQLNILSTALTNLIENPTSAVYQSESTASITSIVSQISSDQYLSQLIPSLIAASTVIAGATTADQVDSAVSGLAPALQNFAQTIAEESSFQFQMLVSPTVQVVTQNAPEVYDIYLEDVGTAAATYDFSVSGLPAGVTATFSLPSITLSPGEEVEPTATLTLSESGTTLIPANFTITTSVDGAPGIAQSIPAQLTLPAESVQVAGVTITPPYTNAGGQVDVSALLQGSVNEPAQVMASYTVTDSGDTVLYTSTPVPVALSVTNGTPTADLGSFDTTGFANGTDTVTVTLADSSGPAITVATMATSVVIGSPVTGTLTSTPGVVPAGNSTVTTTAQINTAAPYPSPLTLQGAVNTAAPGTSVALYQSGGKTYAYEAGSDGVEVIDVTDPTNPQVIETFAQSDLDTGSNSLNLARVINGELLVGSTYSTGTAGFNLLIYSLTAPGSPTPVSSTTINYTFLTDLLVNSSGTDAFVTTAGFLHGTFSSTPYDFFGDFLSVDTSNPAAPALAGSLFNDQGEPYGGDMNSLGGAMVSDNLAYVADLTPGGSNVTTDTGDLSVVNTSNPASMALVTSLKIPGTTQSDDVAIYGNEALVVGASGKSQVALTLLDISNPDDPKILSTQIVPNAEFDSNTNKAIPVVVSLGNGDFAVSGIDTAADSPIILTVGASNTNELVYAATPAPATIDSLTVSGGELYAATPNGLSVYQIGTLVSDPVVFTVNLPAGAAANIVAGSFNVAPTQINTSATGDSLVWDTTFAAGYTNFTYSWQTSLSNAAPAQNVPMTTGATVSFTDFGTPGTTTLPGTTVNVDPIITIIPSTQTVAPGGTADYIIQLTNPTGATVQYDLDPAFLPGVQSSIPSADEDGVYVAAGQTVDVPLEVTINSSDKPTDEAFTVTATQYVDYPIIGANGSAQVNVDIAGSPITPVVPQDDSFGLVVTLNPVTSTVGVGQSAQYEMQVVNTGSVAETITPEALGLPSGVDAAFGESSIQVLPGAGNFVDIPLTLTNVSAAPDTYNFTAVATEGDSNSTTGQAQGSLTVVNNGVSLSFSPSSAAPGHGLELTVTNTGDVTDTFDLALAGAAATVSSLGTSQLTLAAGASQTVPVTTSAANFAVGGPLELDATATSENNSAVEAEATADLTIPTSSGMNAFFTPDSQTLSSPGMATFDLQVNNLGNTQDSYEAIITGTTGPVTAALIGLDGDPTQSIPVFILPGLSTGEISLQADLSAVGQGTVTVQIQSLSDGSIVSTQTATLNVSASNQPPIANADSYTTAEDTTLTIPAAGVLANDTDPNNLPLTASLVSGPSHGVLTLDANGDGGFFYVPDPGYVGSDSFVYAAADSNNLSANATVNLTVTAVAPTAVNDSYTANEDTTLTISAAAGVLANDSAPAGESLVASLVSGTSHGMLTLDANGDGGFTYVPDAGYVGSDSFMYKATDTSGLSTDATVTLKVGAVPMVVSTQVGDGSAQRSTVSSITVVFGEPVNFSAASFTLDETQNENSGFSWTNVSSGVTFSNPSGDGMTWVISVIHGGSLDRTHAGKKGFFSDGIFQLTLNGSAITDAATGLAQLNAGNTQIASFKNGAGVTKNAFSVLFGDMAGTGAPIDNADYADIKAAYGRTLRQTGYNAALDFDGNGIINAIDYGKFKVNYGKSYTFV